MSLSKNFVERKTGKESFVVKGSELTFDLREFWGWSNSELLGNTLRGILAEFIVSKDIECIELVREEWDAFDLISPEGVKIEVKSSAYLQSWHQNKLSSISFGIQPTQAWNEVLKKRNNEKKRQSDVYVFCLFAHKDKPTANPMILDQWVFYVLSTATLNRALENQKSITLSRLLKLNPIQAMYGEIHSAIREQAIIK